MVQPNYHEDEEREFHQEKIRARITSISLQANTDVEHTLSQDNQDKILYASILITLIILLTNIYMW